MYIIQKQYKPLNQTRINNVANYIVNNVSNVHWMVNLGYYLINGETL